MMNHAMRGRALKSAARTFVAAGLLAAALPMVGGSPPPQTFDMALNTETSALAANFDLSAPIAGTFIGDHDPETNPDGTKTIPGLFGGRGNHPLDYSATLLTGGEHDSQPAGTLTLDTDPANGSAQISNLSIDALNLSDGSTAPAFDAVLNLIYSTFHTQNPSGIFPGGFVVPLPLGQVTITTLTLTQTGGTAAGTLTPIGETGTEFTLAALVDVELLLEAEFDGQAINPDPIPLTIAVGGTLVFGDASAFLWIDIEASIKETDEGPFPPFEDIPFGLPTLGGETANLLLSGEIESVTLALDLGAALVAVGTPVEPPDVPGDLNGDGAVGVADLLILLSAWGPCDDCAPGACPPDLDGDCTVGVADLLMLLANWG